MSLLFKTLSPHKMITLKYHIHYWFDFLVILEINYNLTETIKLAIKLAKQNRVTLKCFFPAHLSVQCWTSCSMHIIS